MKNRAGLNNRQPVSHRLLVDGRIIYEADIVEIYKMRKPPLSEEAQ